MNNPNTTYEKEKTVPAINGRISVSESEGQGVLQRDWKKGGICPSCKRTCDAEEVEDFGECVSCTKVTFDAMSNQ